MSTTEPSQMSDPPAGTWADPLGRAGSRAGQVLLLAAVAAGTVWLLQQVTVVVIAVLVALILAAAVSPMVHWLTSKGWPDLLATLASFLAIVAVAGGAITGVVLAIRSEWDSLVSSALGAWDELRDWIASTSLPIDTGVIDDAVQQATEFVTSADFASSTLAGVSAATEVLTGLVLIVVLLFFFLKDGSAMWNFTLRWFRGESRAKLAESIDRAAATLGGYVRGTATVALVDAVLIGIGLALLGVPLAVPLAVIVFLGAFIPVVGATVAGTLAAAVSLVTNGPFTALIVIVIVIAVNQIEGNLLQPVVMGRALSLHPLIVLLALTIGTIVGGIFGAILAVPYTAMAWTLIQVWTDRYQAGDDPVLGEDPLSARERPSRQASEKQREWYRKLRRDDRQGAPLGAVEQEQDTADPTVTDDGEGPATVTADPSDERAPGDDAR